jgi:hypothetical protein
MSGLHSGFDEYLLATSGAAQRGVLMTTPSDGPIPDENEDQPSGAGSTQPEGAPGAELGRSDSGSTFEPEEDVEPDS